MTRHLTMTVHSSPRYWLSIVVYDTAAQMRTAARRHRLGGPPAGGADDDAMGIFQAAPEGTTSQFLGTIRLTEEHLTPEVVIHECVHAALTYTQRLLGVGVLHLAAWSNGRRVIDNEEALAYSVHGIANSLLTELGMLA